MARFSMLRLRDLSTEARPRDCSFDPQASPPNCGLGNLLADDPPNPRSLTADRSLPPDPPPDPKPLSLGGPLLKLDSLSLVGTLSLTADLLFSLLRPLAPLGPVFLLSLNGGGGSAICGFGSSVIGTFVLRTKR